MNDLLLNVPESSGPELQRARDRLAEARADYEAYYGHVSSQCSALCEYAIKKLEEKVAQLEAEAMRKEAR